MARRKTQIWFWLVMGVVSVIMLVLFSLGNGDQPAGSAGADDFGTELSQWIGKPAPDFNLPDMSGQVVKLSEHRGHRMVLFFSEGIMCYPACWNQMAAMRDARLNDDQTMAMSIVVDMPEDWQPAITRMPELAEATILFDVDKRVSQAYETLSLGSSMHRGQTPGHTYYIVDPKGIIRYARDDISMATRNEQLVKALEQI